MSEHIEQADLTDVIRKIVEMLEQVPGVDEVKVFDGENIEDFETLNLNFNEKISVVYVDLASIDFVDSEVCDGTDAEIFFNLYIVAAKDYTDDDRFVNNSMNCLSTLQSCVGKIKNNMMNLPLYTMPEVTGATKFLSRTLNNSNVTAFALTFNIFLNFYKTYKYD